MRQWATGSFPWVMRVLLLAAGLLLSAQSHADEAAGSSSGDELSLELKPQRNRLYQHERIPVTVTLLAGRVSVRNIQYPILNSGALSIGKFDPPRQGSLTRDGQAFTTYQFSSTLSAEKIGKFALGPAQLHCEQLAPANGAAAFFGGSQARSVTVSSQPVQLTILPLPARGRPADYGGAVGQFKISRQVTPTAFSSGDPVTVTTRIEGVGNLDNFPCRSIALAGVRSYPPQSRRSASSLLCEQVLVPESGDGIEIPAERIRYFDPLAGRYRTDISPTVHLVAIDPPSINPQAAVHTSAAKALPELASASPARWSLWVAVSGLFLSAGMALLVVRNKRAAPENLPASSIMDQRLLAEAKAALAADAPHRFYDAVFRLAQAVAAAQCGLPRSGLTVGTLRQIKFNGADPGVLVELFQECDEVRYGQAVRNQTQMARTLQQLQTTLATLG